MAGLPLTTYSWTSAGIPVSTVLALTFKLVLSSPRALGQSDGQDLSAGAITGSGKAARDSLKSLRELRANLTLYFSPETLEKVLLEIEGGEPLAAVESLNVKRQERKVEMSVRVLMRIGVAESEKIDSGMGGEQSSVSKTSPAEDSATGLTGTKPLQAADEAVVGHALFAGRGNYFLDAF